MAGETAERVGAKGAPLSGMARVLPGQHLLPRFGTGHFAGQCSTDSKSAMVGSWPAENTTGAPCLQGEDASPRMR